jgi:hypothetical protein
MSIATKTGDDGTTAVMFGRRVSKTHSRLGRGARRGRPESRRMSSRRTAEPCPRHKCEKQLRKFYRNSSIEIGKVFAL